MFAPMRYLDPVAYEKEMASAEKDLRQLWKEVPWKE